NAHQFVVMKGQSSALLPRMDAPWALTAKRSLFFGDTEGNGFRGHNQATRCGRGKLRSAGSGKPCHYATLAAPPKAKSTAMPADCGRTCRPRGVQVPPLSEGIS